MIDSVQEGHTGLEVTRKNGAAKDSAARRNEEPDLERVVLKVCSQTSSIHITWAFGRNANSQASPQTHCMSNAKDEAQQSVLEHVFQVMLIVRSENHWLCMTPAEEPWLLLPIL